MDSQKLLRTYMTKEKHKKLYSDDYKELNRAFVVIEVIGGLLLIGSLSLIYFDPIRWSLYLLLAILPFNSNHM